MVEQGAIVGTKRVGRVETGRFDVGSADGTSIAVWVEGEGPALVMVHGSIADHTTFEPFVAVLRHDMTTFSIDRRGFGASGDTLAYAIEREFEDVAAVIDAVAARTGGPVAVWGHSYGANCAMGGAALTANVDHLVLYEPSLGIPYPPGSIERIEAALARGDHDAAIAAVLVDILEMTDEEIDVYRCEPAVARPSRRGTHHPEGVPHRGGLGVPTGPVRRDRGADAAVDRLRQRARRDRGDRTGGRGDPRRHDPRARRARPLRASDRPGDGRRDRPPVRRIVSSPQFERPCPSIGTVTRRCCRSRSRRRSSAPFQSTEGTTKMRR